MAVHARTRHQRHEGPVDRGLLAEVKRAVSIPVIGNGGILAPEDALAMRSECGVDAVMVGRAAIGNPWIFEAVREAWEGRRPSEPTPAERLATVEGHLAGCIATLQRRARRARDREGAVIRAVRWIRGHVVGYLRDAPGGRAALLQLNDLNTPEALLEAVREAWLAPSPARAGPTRTNPTARGGRTDQSLPESRVIPDAG